MNWRRAAFEIEVWLVAFATIVAAAGVVAYLIGAIRALWRMLT